MSDTPESTDNPPHAAHAAPSDRAREVLPPIWVIYEDPTDYPGAFVVRVWFGLSPEKTAHAFRTLAAARAYVGTQGGAVRIERSDKDARVIREAWL